MGVYANLTTLYCETSNRVLVDQPQQKRKLFPSDKRRTVTVTTFMLDTSRTKYNANEFLPKDNRMEQKK